MRPLPASWQTDFIPGVHDYCDRLCSACTLAARCLVRQVELRGPTVLSRSPPPQLDAVRRLLAASRQEGDKGSRAVESPSYERIRADALYVQAHGYAEVVDEFVRAVGQPQPDASAHPGALPRRESDTRGGTVAGSGAAGRRRLAIVGRAGEGEWGSPLAQGPPAQGPLSPRGIVLWFQVYIPGKVFRALFDAALPGFDASDAQSDGNGSAKAALLGIERSREAWRQLAPTEPRATQAIWTIVCALDQLQADTEARFPLAWRFVRPGFDDP